MMVEMPHPKQRWDRPFDVRPGHWSQQLPTKHLATAAKGDVSALKVLLKERPEFLNKRANHNRTLLWEATRAGKREAVELLIKRGADVNAVGAYNSESHVQISPYCAACYYKRPTIAAFLQAHGAQQDIFRAAFLGDQEAVAQMLAADPTLLHVEDPFDEIYFIPLVSFAVAGGHLALTEFLIGRGAELAQYSAQLFFLAAKQSRKDLIDVLVAHGADIRAAESGVFLSIADMSLMRYLLELGVPVNQADAHGNVPLVYLTRGDKRQQPEKLQLLLEYGADINAVGPRGRTALHYAAAADHTQTIAWLIQHGARLDMKDDEGSTALDLARAAGKQAAMQLLAGS